MFDYIKRKHIEQRMYYEAFENDASYDEKNPMAKWDSGLWIRYKLFENVLASIPSADVIESKLGKWIYQFRDSENEEYRCSRCNCIGDNGWAFCPHCGAYMKGDKE